MALTIKASILILLTNTTDTVVHVNLSHWSLIYSSFFHFFSNLSSNKKNQVSSDEDESTRKNSRADSDLVSDGSSKDSKLLNGDTSKSFCCIIFLFLIA